MSKNTERYNGWANYQTWNVALWIRNDSGLYESAMQYANEDEPYKSFVAEMREAGYDYCPGMEYETPDGVAWNDSGIDRDEIDDLIRRLGE